MSAHVSQHQYAGVVIVTRDRVDNLCTSLERLQELPERPQIVVVDNGSSDGTPAVVGDRFPDVKVIALHLNLGAAARNVGVDALSTDYVAFCDDDSWWAAGALPRAADLFGRHPSLGLLAGKVLTGECAKPDPVCTLMANSPLGQPSGLPGPSILGFMACGTIVRREAFVSTDGFDPHFGIGGEEELLALSLAANNWDLAYVDDIVAFHHPSPIRNRQHRSMVITRNHLWTTWLRRPLGRVTNETLSVLGQAMTHRPARLGMAEAVQGLPWVLRRRRRLPDHVETMVRRLERAGAVG